MMQLFCTHDQKDWDGYAWRCKACLCAVTAGTFSNRLPEWDFSVEDVMRSMRHARALVQRMSFRVIRGDKK